MHFIFTEVHKQDHVWSRQRGFTNTVKMQTDRVIHDVKI